MNIHYEYWYQALIVVLIRRIILYICGYINVWESLIYGIGTDIIEISRVKKQLGKISGLRDQLFTPLEINYCISKKYQEQHFAARLAAKEAFFKALGTGWRNGMAYQEIEISNDKLGKPEINLTGKCKEHTSSEGIKSIHLSISHIKEYANATVVLEY